MLVEQNLPFKWALKNKRLSVRFLVAAFFLAAIIIPNAYKNGNVYKKITPRNIVPYEKIAQLVAENFTIYTRSSTIRMPAVTWKNFSQVEYQVFQYSVRETKFGSGIRVTSEVTVLDSASNVEFSKAVNFPYHIYRLTRLHPSIITLLRNLTNTFYEGSRNENDKEQLRKIFRRNEEGLLLHGLKECNQVAVLLPRDT